MSYDPSEWDDIDSDLDSDLDDEGEPAGASDALGEVEMPAEPATLDNIPEGEAFEALAENREPSEEFLRKQFAEEKARRETQAELDQFRAFQRETLIGYGFDPSTGKWSQREAPAVEPAEPTVEDNPELGVAARLSESQWVEFLQLREAVNGGAYISPNAVSQEALAAFRALSGDGSDDDGD